MPVFPVKSKSPVVPLLQSPTTVSGSPAATPVTKTAWSAAPVDGSALRLGAIRIAAPQLFDGQPASGKVGEVTTGVGANLRVTSDGGQPVSASSRTQAFPSKVTIRYEDKQNYFLNASKLQAYVGLFGGAIRELPVDKSGNMLELTRQADGSYSGNLVTSRESSSAGGPPSKSSIALAFTDGKGKWDSNGGFAQNHRMNLR